MSSRNLPSHKSKSDHGDEGNSLLAGTNSDYITFTSSPDTTSKNPSKATTRMQKARSYLTADIDTRWTDLVLVVCFGESGLIDSGAYNAYNCFTSMMTGNTIFAALGVSDLPLSSPHSAWTKSLASILAFLLGAILTCTFHRSCGPKKRWVLATSFLFQAVLIAVSACLVSGGATSDSPAKKPSPSSMYGLPADPGFPWLDLLPISLLSFQAAGKLVASRMVEMNALPTVVLTTLYHDLITDPALLSAGLLGNVGRNRRLGALVWYFGGAVAGGAFARSSLGFGGLLWTAAGVKLGMVCAWLLWREDCEKGDEED
ncbi:hypothetical protein LTR08_008694 [Meristemomyces frigidus]|nr:hypothetical protein LTR08_008694 [Meristemomyces frigidus]